THIKGFKKYGRVWKLTTHSRQAIVLITNEHKISLTCVYCFRKTSHPVQIF
ncbi:hypothetical protein BDF21DRAFT_322575, partial [Thamnidium elegans]